MDTHVCIQHLKTSFSSFSNNFSQWYIMAQIFPSRDIYPCKWVWRESTLAGNLSCSWWSRPCSAGRARQGLVTDARPVPGWSGRIPSTVHQGLTLHESNNNTLLGARKRFFQPCYFLDSLCDTIVATSCYRSPIFLYSYWHKNAGFWIFTFRNILYQVKGNFPHSGSIWFVSFYWIQSSYWMF